MKLIYAYSMVVLFGTFWVNGASADLGVLSSSNMPQSTQKEPEAQEEVPLNSSEAARYDNAVMPHPVYTPYPAYMGMNPYVPYAAYYPPGVVPYGPNPLSSAPSPSQPPPVTFAARKPTNLDAKYKGKMWFGGAVTQTLANTIGRNAALSGDQRMVNVAQTVQDVGQVMSLMNQMRGKNGSFTGSNNTKKKNPSQNGKFGQNRNQQNTNVPPKLQPQPAFGKIIKNHSMAPLVEKPKSAQEALQEGKRIDGKNNKQGEKKTNL